jgi:hypothetical protein
MKKKSLGLIASTAVVGFLASAPIALADDHGHGGAAPKCQNNTCKGHSKCKGLGNASCAGKNTCKGKGVLEAADKTACEAAGGKWLEAKAPAKAPAHK